jgi:hypothetical protein
MYRPEDGDLLPFQTDGDLEVYLINPKLGLKVVLTGSSSLCQS